MEHREHHRIDLTAAERERLQELAIETRSRPTRGTAAYVADWKFLIRRIGRGEIELVERIPYTLPAGLDDAIAANEERQREQEQREEQRRRIISHTAQKQVVRKTPVKLEQLSMLDLEPA
jgi:hypothetical protein